MLGRTPGALDAAANRLLKPGDRPASRSYAWTVLIEEVNTSTIRTDWWARYLQGRLPPHPSRSSRYEGSRADLVTLDSAYSGEIDLGVLVLEAVNERSTICGAINLIPQSQSCSLMRYSTVRLGGPHCNNYGSRERFPRQSTCRPTLSKQTRHLAQRPINSAPR